ncbi:anti-sigma factor [Penaeicola halotolerans]|uniref:anti-sigma factor n=1 Tax=Penaeicola halotolerans TaxID=2793196 RepID=UPI001CF826A9|nr:anti-sigma factor [Penaeicola halotolerans]
MEKEPTNGEKKLTCGDKAACMQLLEMILDGQADDDQCAQLESKLEKCLPCFEYYHLEKTIREVMKSKCTNKEVPKDLLSNIREIIAKA